ncbi:NYN domain-containing protein [Nostoc sp.]|uniref:NYN domain-containing protein n=1 Tax=Nostoc sp. TaxID=1180 RepID=UPI002FEEF8B4
MPSANQSSNRQTNQQQLKVGIYCDFQNVYLSQNIASSLLAFAKARGNLIIRRVYYNSLFENQASAKENLQRIGFQCEDVTCSLKNSADNQLKSDLIDDVYNNQSPDIFILVSGDGDFANPVKFLQDKDKNVIIFARRGNVKQSLKNLADELYFVDELPQLVDKLAA